MSDRPVIPTAACADACVQLGIELRVAPGLRPIDPQWAIMGSALPVIHLGSVDVFLEACDDLQPGEILVVDDGGRSDRACVGDLTALEVKGAGAAGMIVWGCHRDTVQLLDVGLPVFSLGVRPNGPLGVEPADHSRPLLGEHEIKRGDIVVADADGVVALPAGRAEEVLAAAAEIARTESEQATAMRDGRSLRDQLEFAAYQERRRDDPEHTFREHLRRRGGAIER